MATPQGIALAVCGRKVNKDVLIFSIGLVGIAACAVGSVLGLVIGLVVGSALRGLLIGFLVGLAATAAAAPVCRMTSMDPVLACPWCGQGTQAIDGDERQCPSCSKAFVCEVVGPNQYRVEKCGRKYQPATQSPHSWQGCLCSRCGERKPNPVAADHDRGRYCVCKRCGVTSHEWGKCTCLHCGAHKPNVQLADHTWQGCCCAQCKVRKPNAALSEHEWEACTCRHCGDLKPGTVANDHSWAGQTCPRCGMPQRLFTKGNEAFHCPKCGTSLKLPVHESDNMRKCPKCATSVPVPKFLSEEQLKTLVHIARLPIVPLTDPLHAEPKRIHTNFAGMSLHRHLKDLRDKLPLFAEQGYCCTLQENRVYLERRSGRNVDNVRIVKRAENEWGEYHDGYWPD